jgi:hypothetical protein
VAHYEVMWNSSRSCGRSPLSRISDLAVIPYQPSHIDLLHRASLTGAREITMRRRHPPTGLIVVLCGFTAGVVAQAACRPPAPVSGASTHERVTVTGCVTSLTRTVGTDGHQNGLSHGNRYILTNAGARASSAASATAAADSHRLSRVFWLDASDSQAWSYVGSGVEVQGTLEGNRSVSIVDAESRMRPATLSFVRDSGGLPELPVVKAESIHPIALHCSS